MIVKVACYVEQCIIDFKGMKNGFETWLTLIDYSGFRVAWHLQTISPEQPGKPHDRSREKNGGFKRSGFDAGLSGLSWAYLGIWSQCHVKSQSRESCSLATQKLLQPLFDAVTSCLDKLQAERQEDVGQGDRLVGAKRQGGSLGLRF